MAYGLDNTCAITRVNWLNWVAFPPIELTTHEKYRTHPAGKFCKVTVTSLLPCSMPVSRQPLRSQEDPSLAKLDINRIKPVGFDFAATGGLLHVI